MDDLSLRKILELLLWMTDRPLKPADFKEILGEECPPEDKLREEILNVGKELDLRDAPMQLMEVAEGFQTASRPLYSPWVRRLYKERTTLRLSPSALETLSIIAYRQPITRSGIEEIRGVEVSGVLENLLERKLVRIVGRKEVMGRPLLYGTTPDFMRQFGLKSLAELPRLEELVPLEEASAAPASDGEEGQK
ncbi:MAG: SMC-Scp complex subunit ScpB [Elusimicrobiota bacterium]|jgi:segregation and condensation protein B